MKIEIKSVFGKVLFSTDAETLRDAVIEAVKQKTDLREADLREADLSGANLPSPQMMLSASWGEISSSLTADLMEYDASSHPDRSMFDAWTNDGPCPYSNIKIQRAANFTEKKELWGKGKIDTPYNLMMRLFAERGIKR